MTRPTTSNEGASDPGAQGPDAQNPDAQNPDAQNPDASTGTMPDETFVGRAGPDETMDPGLSGAEARAGEAADGRGEGAARDA